MACCLGLPGIQGRDSRTKPPPSRAHPRERLPWRVSSEMRRCPGPFPAFDPAIPTIFLNFRCLIFFLKPFWPLCLILCQYPVPQLPLHVAPDDVVPSARAQCTCVSVIWLSGSGDGIWFIESGYCLFFFPLHVFITWLCRYQGHESPFKDTWYKNYDNDYSSHVLSPMLRTYSFLIFTAALGGRCCYHPRSKDEQHSRTRPVRV